MRRFTNPLRPHAFEASVALNALVVAVTGLLGYTQWSVVTALYLPGWLSTAADVTYLAGGVLVLAGLLRRRAHVELAGLLLLGSMAVVRTVISGTAVFEYGPTIYVGMALFHAFLTLGCGGRVHAILDGERVVVVRGER